MVLAHNLMEGARTRDIEISVDVTFDSMLLSKNTMDGLKTSGFHKPSPIQLHGIPLGKCGFDLFLEAKSGTGKTAVFTVIALEKIDLNKGLQSVILAPTREIAAQIADVIKQLGSKYVGLNVEVVMGGLPIEEDIAKFQKKVHILVGSPGRMRHLIHKKHIDISAVRLLVLDEADKLMDRGFVADINYIFSNLPKQKQVIMSSATYPDTLKDILQNYVQKAQHICPDSTNILLGIKQYVTTVKSNLNIVVQTQNRFEELLNILSTIEFKQCLIFCNYQVRVRDLCNMLVQNKWPAEQLHGQLEQNERLGALKTLKEYKCRILVSTDLAARGIDASNVNLIINFEPPSEWQTYLHRIGRAGRFGSYGIAVSIVSEGKELKKFKVMKKTIGQSLKINYLSNGNELSDYDEVGESQENKKSQILDMGDGSNTPQIDEVIKTQSVEDNHNSTSNKITETLQVKITCETSNNVDKKFKTQETEKSNVLNIEKETDAEATFSNNSNIKMEEQLSEILVPQMIELSNVEYKTFSDGFILHEAPEEVKIESFNDLMESFKKCEQESNGANQDETTTTVTVESKRTDDDTFFKRSEESCAKSLIANEAPVTLQSFNDLIESFKTCEQASNDSFENQNETTTTVTVESKTTDDDTFFNSSEESCGNAFIANEAPAKFKIESFNDLMESFKKSVQASNDSFANQNETTTTITVESITTADDKFFNSSEESCAKALIANEAPETFKLESYNDLLDYFNEQKIESYNAIANQDESFKGLIEKNKTNDNYTLLNSSEESCAKTFISNEAPGQIKLESFNDLMYSFKVHELKNSDTFRIQNDSFKAVSENIKTADEHTLLNSSEASPISNGDDGYNTNSCLLSRSTKSMQPQMKRKSDKCSSSSKISNKGMDTRSDINAKYNNWYKQFKTRMQQIEMSLYIEELSKM